MLKVLLKKEFLDLIHSYKSIVCIIVVAISPFLISFVKKENIPIFAYCIIMQVMVGQFIYDSYIQDINFGGALFLENLGSGFFEIFLSKILVSLFFTVLVFAADFIKVYSELGLIQSITLFVSCIYACEFMFLASCFSKGAEMTSEFCVAILLTIIQFGFLNIKSDVICLIIAVFIAVIFYFLCSKMYKSKKYKTLM